MVHSDMNVIAWCNIAWDDGFGQQCGLNLDNLTGYAYIITRSPLENLLQHLFIKHILNIIFVIFFHKVLISLRKSIVLFSLIVNRIIKTNIRSFLINQDSSISKILIFQVPERLYQLVDRSTDGLVTADQVMEFIAGLQSIRYDKTC